MGRANTMRSMRGPEVAAILQALGDEAAMMSESNGDYQEDPGLRSDLLAAADNAEVAGVALMAAAGRMRASVDAGAPPEEPTAVQELAAQDWGVAAVNGWTIEDTIEYATHNLLTEWSRG